MQSRVIAPLLFFVVIAINVMDRQMMAILGESIKLDLGLSDTQLGALSGPLFAIFYAIAGIPIAMLADRTDRVRVLGWSTAIAGVFAAMGGLAASFLILALSRAAVAIGDAGGPPPIWSLVSTYYSEERRASRIGLIQLGAPTGAVLAFVLGGLVAAYLGWRWGFFLVGGAGVIAGLAVLFFVPEPRRVASAGNRSPTGKEPSSGSLGILMQSQSFRWGLGGVALAGAAMFGLGMWAPSVMQRQYQWSPDQTGLSLGVATAIAGFAGTYFSGVLASTRRRHGDLGAEFSVPCWAMLACLPILAGSYLANAASVALLAYGASTFFLLAWNAPTIAGFQFIAPERGRALAASLHVFSVNMFGLGIGPLAIGALSEALTPILGVQALALSITLFCGPAVLGAAFCFWMASRIQRQAANSLQHEADRH